MQHMHWIFAVVSFAIFITDNQRLWLHKGQLYQSILLSVIRTKNKCKIVCHFECIGWSLRLVFKRMEFNHWDGENKAHCFIPKTCFVPIFHLFSSFTIFILHSKNKQKYEVWKKNAVITIRLCTHCSKLSGQMFSHPSLH